MSDSQPPQKKIGEGVSVGEGATVGLPRFFSEKAKKLLRNMPKSCSKVAQN